MDNLIGSRIQKQIHLVIIVVLLLLDGCKAVSQETASTNTQPTSVGTSATPTQLPEIPPITTPFPTSTTALSDTGPWLLYSNYKDSAIIIRDIKGDNFIELNPPTDRLFSKFPYISPSGARFAILTYGASSNVIELSVYHLPSLDKEFQTILFPEEATVDGKNIGTHDPILYSQYLYAQSKELALWSPEGRYLAFVSDLLFPDHQLILYDTQTGIQEMLFTSDQFIRMFAWSLDGEHLLFYTVERSDPFSEKHPTYSIAVSSGRITEIGTASPSTWSVHLLGWLNYIQLVVIDNIWDNSPMNLRLLDVNLDHETILYPYRVGEVAFNSLSSTLIFDVWNLAWMVEPNPQPKELQIISLPNLEITSLPLRDYSDIIWHDSLGLFSAVGSDTLILFNAAGKIFLEFPNTPQEPTRIYPSPDGQYILIAMENNLSLIPIDGDVVHKYPAAETKRVLWMPDSQSFFWSIESDYGNDLFHCVAANQWQEALIDTEIESSSLMLINE